MEPERKDPNPSGQERGMSPEGGHAGKPLDGSQYVDVVEEQLYSEQRPTRDAREPHTGDKTPKRSQVTGTENAATSDL